MLRKLVLWLLPGMASRFEQDSRDWMVQCTKCGHEISVWEAGGIRYKARGTVRRLGNCSNCGKTSMLRIYHKPTADSQQ